MSKEKDIQILEYKINDLTKKIAIYRSTKVSEKKIKELSLMKLKYEDQLNDILNK